MTLSVDHLTAHGFTPRTVATWRGGLGPTLLPLQEKALRDFGFLHGRDRVVFAPTASGKTFVAELAALRHLEQGRAVAFLVPTRALAEEKSREFSARYRDLGLRIVCATRERPENDRRVAEGHFDWLVAVYEKFSAHLVSHPGLLGCLGLIVADELQMLGDRERGPALDVLLTKVRLAPYAVQRLALSAVLSDALRIANWLDADLLQFDQRPVDLLEGVVDVETGSFHWRSFNSGARGCDPLATVFDGTSPRGDSSLSVPGKLTPRRATVQPLGPRLPDNPDEFHRDAVLALARWIAEDCGEQVLVFVPTRWMSRAWAEEAAFHSRLEPARVALDALERHESNRGRDLLATCFQAGVGFHNADLPAALRGLVEHHFQSGALRVLFSTPTLAQGVNLAGRNVIQVPHMVGEDPWTGQASVVPLSRERFRNQGGRAARTIRETHAGRSMVLAGGDAEVERLVRLLVEGELEEIVPPLDGADLAPALLDLLVSGVARSVEGLVQFLLETYTGQTVWSTDAPHVRRRVLDALQRLEQARLLRVLQDGGMIETGGLAQAVAAAGILPETARLLVNWLDARRDSARGDPSVEPIVAAVLAREMRPVLPPLIGPEYTEPDLFKELQRRLAPDRTPGGRHLWDQMARLTGFTADDRRSAKLALLLQDWIGPEDTEALETRYGVLSGSIASAGAQAAWILRAAGALAAALGLPGAPDSLRLLADRLEPGVGEEGVELARLRVEGLGRGAVGALVREGIRSAADVRAWPVDRLRSLLPEELCAALLSASGASDFGEWDASTPGSPSGSGGSASGDPPASGASAASLGAPVDSTGDPATSPGLQVAEFSPRFPSPATPSLRISSPAGSDSSEGHPILVIDSQSPGMIEWAGQPLRLTDLPFRLLLALARKPGRGVTYRELVDRIWQGQAVVERQQVNYHRQRVVDALATAMPRAAAKALITTHSGQGMVLNLSPDQVRLV